MKTDYIDSNKIKENKYKILRMSLLLGAGDNKEELLNNYEDASREIDAMNDEIYLKTVEDKFYDTTTLEEESKKLTSLCDYISGRVEQRISLLTDFSNVTGYDLQNLPIIKYYDKLDDYKERLGYVNEYLDNSEKIKQIDEDLQIAEATLKESYDKKASYEDCNLRNEEIIANRFKTLTSSIELLKNTDATEIDDNLEKISSLVDESKKSLDIFNKSYQTLQVSGITEEEKSEYYSYVKNAAELYYQNKENEYLLRLNKLLLIKEQEYEKILDKRESINGIILDRLNLRNELSIEDNDILDNLYDTLKKQYDDIVKQQDIIKNIDDLNELIQIKKAEKNELEIDNNKVEILSILREYGLVETYIENNKEVEENNDYFSENTVSNELDDIKIEEPVPNSSESISIEVNEEATSNESVEEYMNSISNFDIDNNENQNDDTDEELTIEYEDNQVIDVKEAQNLDLELIHTKASKVMNRVGEMLNIKPKNDKIVSVTNDIIEAPKEIEQVENSTIDTVEEPTTITEEVTTEDNNSSNIPFLNENNENPLFTNTVEDEEITSDDGDNFWFPSDTPDALNELPDLDVNNTTMPELNFPDLNFDFGNSEEGK